MLYFMKQLYAKERKKKHQFENMNQNSGNFKKTNKERKRKYYLSMVLSIVIYNTTFKKDFFNKKKYIHKI